MKIKFNKYWLSGFGWEQTVFIPEDFVEVKEVLKKDNDSVIFIAFNKFGDKHLFIGKYLAQNNVNWYHCSNCNVITQRDSKQKTIKSTCENTGKKSTLVRIDDAGKLAKKLCKSYLKNGVDLKNSTPNEIAIYKMIFQQAVMITFNGIRV